MAWTRQAIPPIRLPPVSMKPLASVAGLLLGGMATLVWLQTARWFGDKVFWGSARQLTASLLADPTNDEFFQQYLKLLRSLSVYLLKTTARVTATVLPIILALYFLSPIFARRQAQIATHLTAYPPQAIELRILSGTLPGSGGQYDWPGKNRGPLSVSTPDWSTHVDYAQPVVMTNSLFKKYAYQACGFHVVHAEHAPDLLLLRPSAADSNPFWPYLNDTEFLFWICVAMASLAVATFCCKFSLSEDSRRRLPKSPSARLQRVPCQLEADS